jgi:hypothetical protein
MGYDIVRLFALDWDRTVAALRAHGDDFYWLARESLADDIDYARIPFVAEYAGPLANVPGRRDPTANPIYDELRTHLDTDARKTCDACFSRLFWDSALLADLPPLDGVEAQIWNALSPASVREVLGFVPRLPWDALRRAADRCRWTSDYLPTIDDFESQVGCHESFLVEAAERGAGVLALVSA